METENNSNTFVTSRGVRVEFVGIATLLDKLSQTYARKTPQPPTYQVQTATGAVETHAHDDSTLETDADKAAWAEYVKQRDAAQQQYNLDFMRLILLKGITVEMPQDSAWVEEHALMGLTVPEKPLERKLHWLETEVVGNVNDATKIVAGVMLASGMDEEAIRAAEDSFRSDVQRRPAGETAGADSAG